MMTVLTSLFHLQTPGQSTSQPTSNNRSVKYNLTREVPDFDPFGTATDEVGASAVLETAGRNRPHRQCGHPQQQPHRRRLRPLRRPRLRNH